MQGGHICQLENFIQGPVRSDRTHHFVNSPVVEDFRWVRHFGVSESFMPAPSTVAQVNKL